MKLDEFKVVSPIINTLSVSDMRISTTQLTFNTITAAELGYPPYVRLLIHPSGRLFAIQAWPDNSVEDAVPFFTDSVYAEQQKKGRATVKIRNRVLTQILREKMGWTGKETMRAFGVRYMDEKAILYNLEDAVLSRGSRAKKVTLDEILESYPTVKDSMKNMLAIPAKHVADTSATVVEGTVIDIDYAEIEEKKGA